MNANILHRIRRMRVPTTSPPDDLPTGRSRRSSPEGFGNNQLLRSWLERRFRTIRGNNPTKS